MNLFIFQIISLILINPQVESCSSLAIIDKLVEYLKHEDYYCDNTVVFYRENKKEIFILNDSTTSSREKTKAVKGELATLNYLKIISINKTIDDTY